MVRLFVAAELPEEIRNSYAEAQEGVRRSRARLSLVDPGDMHITLKFIGETPGSLLPALTAALETVPGSPFSLDLGAVTLNSPRSPRVIWGDIHDNGACRDLAGRIETVLVPLGIPVEKRRFTPHITIARIKQFHPSIFEEVAEISTSCSGSFMVDRFVLKKSELTVNGPVYTDILEVPL
ncbi:MAG: RNA 2',3'-cyclic phosphodiesterase [Methanomicrobiales archaeon HGW-Methanomicrobiales-4]|nr:MAG: RNA 2',3'-cyclic phosphodiesterase [Methanomicrobiales archaeon HGW-Methanomicrobiales-4]